MVERRIEMSDAILAALIIGGISVLVALITLILTREARKIKTQKKYDKLVEFQELASPISKAMLSQANKIIRGEKNYVDDFNNPNIMHVDKQGVSQMFWDVHAFYEPLIPRKLWKAYENLGPVYERLRDETNIENAKRFIDAYESFTKVLKKLL